MKRAFLFRYCVLSLLFSTGMLWVDTSLKAQSVSIILGRPTDQSVTVSLMFDSQVNYYLKYGILPGIYTDSTAVFSANADVPAETDLTQLTVNTQYYYRLAYKTPNANKYTYSPQYQFHTQRAPGSEFQFTIEADEHLYDKKGVMSIYQISLNNELKDQPDFMLSLGDIFGDDHEWQTITSAQVDSLHKVYRPVLGSVCHSIPFYICLGNHEGENDYYYNQNPGNNLCVWGTQWRKYYFPNPFPNNFYSGNTDNEAYGIGNPENYYAWTWGDAQFIVLDVYRDQCDTSDKPQKWAWTLGLPQYTWLKNTLENSTAKYKFVFAHHIRGQGRGGVTNATQFEWGGYQSSNYTFDQYRPGWAKPIHQLFVDNGVNIFFQGHDHVFAHEILDGITYQAVPMPSDSTYQIGMLANADAYVSDTVDGTGYLRVKVNASCVTVDYVRSYLPADTVSGLHHNGEVAFSYTIGNCITSDNHSDQIQEEMQILPNPAKDYALVKFNHSELAETEIQNAIGQTIAKQQSPLVDLREFNSGLYIIRATTVKGQKYSQKFIISK